MKPIAIGLIVTALLVFGAGVVFAQSIGGNTGGSGVELQNPVGADSIIEIINNIIGALQVYIAPPIVAIMVLIGAFQILFAAGNPERVKTGRKTIIYAVIGYAIIFVAGGITSLIENILSG